MFSWLQSAATPLDATESCAQDQQIRKMIENVHLTTELPDVPLRALAGRVVTSVRRALPSCVQCFISFLSHVQTPITREAVEKKLWNVSSVGEGVCLKNRTYQNDTCMSIANQMGTS